jgi:hypothetical protein
VGDQGRRGAQGQARGPHRPQQRFCILFKMRRQWKIEICMDKSPQKGQMRNGKSVSQAPAGIYLVDLVAG